MMLYPKESGCQRKRFQENPVAVIWYPENLVTRESGNKKAGFEGIWFPENPVSKESGFQRIQFPDNVGTR